ncbi:hypothetical protein SH601_14295 [Gracilibacillus sp. S3-1-1]|uniref:Uncharacterized protein n=1 Tax=Gracilibacillus pellucidus TaxID=3095368 RepID=A0ACC6M845_9BACI|nr:hypothetical protein [Gracilibacillus sp. S3-1-1]MDX8047158.1 hypothetical protein [Gracilibacillus sp. S3-1-1]
MDVLLQITIGFIIIGFVVLASMKKGMESKLAIIKADMEGEPSSTKKAKSIIWWIWSTTAWGIVSMFLAVWCFHNYFG